jgi:hypothetical protein
VLWLVLSVARLPVHLVQLLTADLHLIPQLRLGLLALLLVAAFCILLGGSGSAFALYGNLASMHIAVRLHA